MRISLVTTVRDEERSIGMLLEGIRCQSRQPDEWIVVDGGSRDRTVQALKNARICAVYSFPGNIAQGRNHGIRLARGDIIVLTDAGVRPHEDWLEKLIRPLLDGKADISAGQTRAMIDRPFDAAQHTLMDQFLILHLPWRRPTISGRSLAFLRSAWDICPFPDWLDYAEDTWLLAAWANKGLRIALVKDALVDWTMRPDIKSFALQYFRYMRGEGRGRLHMGRHLLRMGFYTVLFTFLFKGLPLAAIILWSIYLGASAVRLRNSVIGQTKGFVAAAVAWIPFALVVMDFSKAAGAVLGTMERLFHRSYNKPRS